MFNEGFVWFGSEECDTDVGPRASLTAGLVMAGLLAATGLGILVVLHPWLLLGFVTIGYAVTVIVVDHDPRRRQFAVIAAASTAVYFTVPLPAAASPAIAALAAAAVTAVFTLRRRDRSPDQ